MAADRDPKGCPFDLNALFPIPRAVLEKGGKAAAEWMWANWGTRSAPWRVSFETALRRAGEGVRQVYAFTFLTEDWSPWVAVAKLRTRWPMLEFELRPDYLVDVATTPRSPRSAELAAPRPTHPTARQRHPRTRSRTRGPGIPGRTMSGVQE